MWKREDSGEEGIYLLDYKGRIYVVLNVLVLKCLKIFVNFLIRCGLILEKRDDGGRGVCFLVFVVIVGRGVVEFVLNVFFFCIYYLICIVKVYKKNSIVFRFLNEFRKNSIKRE